MEDIYIKTENGIELAATVYPQKGDQELCGAVMIGPATGIRRIFYRSFATFLSEHGFGVITFDNHGIGDSVADATAAVKPSLTSWGSNDMPAVLRALQVHFPGVSYHLVGHSAGGQLLGLMDNVHDLTSIFNVAASSGSIRNMRYPFKISGNFYLNYFIPASNFLFGRTNSQWVGMGEPLPRKVAADWRRWCNGSGYVATDFGTHIIDHLYDSIRAPSLWVHASDDQIANLANVKDMLRILPNSPATIRTLVPAEWDYKDIGHMKFFSSKRSALWAIALEWLRANST